MNGILTLSGVWYKLRTDPILKFLIVAISFYMIATFEGPLLSIKTVNSLSHYTDWTIGHVHAGTLGWVAMISIRSEEHTSELQSLMRISYAVFCLKQKKQ